MASEARADTALPFGSSAVFGSFVASIVGGRRRGGGEDPWLCGPGFARVCLCRVMVGLSYGGVLGLSRAGEGKYRVSSDCPGHPELIEVMRHNEPRVILKHPPRDPDRR
jgi:hypothetical protein